MTVHLNQASDLAPLATAFARSVKSEGLSPNSIEVYLRAVHEYDKFADSNDLPREVPKITRRHLEAFQDDQLTNNSPATAAARYAGLRRFFRWCVDEGEIKASPMDKMRPPKVPEVARVALPTEAIEKILRTCDGPSFRQRRDRALLGFMADTGCRRSEVAGLRLSDIDQDKQVATVTGKGNKTREVPYSTKTAVAIDRYLRGREKHSKAKQSEALWLGQAGPLSPDAVNGVVGRRAERAGVFDADGTMVHAHLFRHAWADRFLRSRAGNEADLMTLGGWTSIEVARSYGRGNRTERAIDAARLMFGDA